MDEQWRTMSVPTQIIFGVDAHSVISREVEEFDSQRVFLVTDEGVSRTDFFRKIMEQLKSGGIEAEVFSEVEPDPSAKTVEKAFELYQKKRVPVLLAIGGGSPMDVAKAVGILATNGGRIHDYEGIDMFKIPPPPLIAIPTTAGTGSVYGGGRTFCRDYRAKFKAVPGKGNKADYMPFPP